MLLGKRWGRKWPGLILPLLGLVLAISGCRTTKIESEPVEDYTLNLMLDKSVYRPGECVVVTLKLINNTKKQINVRALDAGSVSFFFGRSGNPEKMKRSPVMSNLEKDNGMLELAPGGVEQRQFLLTRFTHWSGPLVAQAHYDPNPEMATGPYPKLYSNTKTFQVTGDKLFDRDPGGYITKAEAIKIAQGRAPGDVQGADAVMIEDADTGLNVWWVNIKVAAAGQPAMLKSWFINPYTGTIKGEAKPFDPKLAADQRLQRPPGGAGNGERAPTPAQ
jgi:hypothetical protein